MTDEQDDMRNGWRLLCAPHPHGLAGNLFSFSQVLALRRGHSLFTIASFHYCIFWWLSVLLQIVYIFFSFRGSLSLLTSSTWVELIPLQVVHQGGTSGPRLGIPKNSLLLALVVEGTLTQLRPTAVKLRIWSSLSGRTLSWKDVSLQLSGSTMAHMRMQQIS